MAVSRANNHIDNSRRNKLLILEMVRDKGPLSRREISAGCNLSMATAKRLVDELRTDGFIREGSLMAKPGVPGRRSSLLQLNGKQGYAMGFSVDRQHVGVNIIDLAGQSLYEGAVPVTDYRPEEVIESLARTAETLRADFDARRRGRFLGIGVAVAGLVDASTGLVHFCPNLPGWENVSLMKQLVDRLDAKVVVDEGVRCMAIAEKRLGLGRDLPICLFVYVGSGVGAGIILDNKVYRGKNGMSGEFGHVVIREDGPICNCGNRGCLEALVSTSGVVQSVQSLISSNVYTKLRIRAEVGQQVTLEDIARAAAEGDKLANMVIHETAEYIGAGLVALVNIFDPGTVILGGEVIENLGDVLVDDVAKTVALRGIHSLAQRTTILRSRFRFNSAALGAATLPVEEFFETGMLNIG